MNNKTLLALLLTISTAAIQAQQLAEQRIQDSVIGWWANNKYDHFKPQTDPVAKKKEVHINNMLAWMKQSYTPVGGLGTYSRYIAQQHYGINFLVWNVSHEKQWLDEKGNFRPIPEENTKFNMVANALYGAFEIYFINKPGTFYFIMQPDGYAMDIDFLKKRQAQNADPRIDPNVYKYITWVNEWQTVYLAPNNKLPWVQVSKGELLQKAEAGLENAYKDLRKEVETNWPNNKKTQDEVYAERGKEIEKYRNNIHILQERYKNSLNEPAYIRAMQPTWRDFRAEAPDIFTADELSKKLGHYYPVYKLDGDAYAKLSSDQPSWIAVAWPHETKENGNQLYEMATSMAQNINYDYIYNYFFNPDKVKGIAYTPANADKLKARLDAYRVKNKASLTAEVKTALPPGVFFKEDFADSPEGGDPKNWYYKSAGTHPVVTSAPGQQGKWLRPGYNNPVIPSVMPRPLPANFTMEFDLATDAFSAQSGGAVKLYMSTYSSGAYGMEIKKGEGKMVEITFTAGLEEAFKAGYNYRGEARINVYSVPEVNTENFSGGLKNVYPLGEFTDKKNKVHITVKLNNGELTLSANGKQFATSNNFTMTYGGKCKDCNTLAGAQFKTVTFENLTYAWPADEKKVAPYISNMVITKN